MFGRPYNLLMRHKIYRALPHREGGGVPRDIVTGHYDLAAVRAQLRKELRCIRNVDMFALLVAHVIRLHSKAATGAISTPASSSGKQSATSARAVPAAFSRSLSPCL